MFYVFNDCFLVKILPAALVAAVMLMAFSSGVAAAEDQTSHVEAQPFPSITLNMSGGVYYNLSYIALILKTHNGSYVATFNHEKWNFTTGNNGTYSYASDVRFLPDNSQGLPGVSIYSQGNGGAQGKNGSGNNSSSGNPPLNSTHGSHGGSPPEGITHNTTDANVVINLKALNYSLSNMSVRNSSAESQNFSFPQYSMLEITISVTFQNPVKGPGNLELVQLIKSSNETNSADRYYFGSIVHDNSKKLHDNSQGIQIPTGHNNSGNGTVNAFYWWNSIFDLNGVKQNLSSTVALSDGGIYIMFDFAFNNSTSLKSVYQDPYIGISGAPIFKNPIVKKVEGAIVNYVMINIESLSTGIAFGSVLIGSAVYSVYRKRRF